MLCGEMVAVYVAVITAALSVMAQPCQDVESCPAVRTLLHDGNATTPSTTFDVSRLQSNRTRDDLQPRLGEPHLGALTYKEQVQVLAITLILLVAFASFIVLCMLLVVMPIFRYLWATLAARPGLRAVLRVLVFACWLRLWLTDKWPPVWLATRLPSGLLCRLGAAFGIALDFEWWGRDQIRLRIVLFWLRVSPARWMVDVFYVFSPPTLFRDQLQMYFAFALMDLAFDPLSCAIVRTLSDLPVRLRMHTVPRRTSSHRATLYLLRTSAGPRPVVAYLQAQPRPVHLGRSRV